MRELFHDLSVTQNLKPATRNASEDGADQDLQGFESCLFEINAGVITDGTHTVEIQESDDGGGSGYTAVAAADLVGDSEPAMDSSTDDQVWRIAYIGAKRYVRASVTVAGATTGGDYSISCLLNTARHRPVEETQAP